MLRDPAAYASQLTDAFVRDLRESPFLTDVIDERRITQEGFRNLILGDIQRSITGASGPELFPNMRAFVRRQIDAETEAKAAGVAGLGLDTGMLGGIGSITGAVTGIVSAVWGAKINAGAVKNIQKTQLQEAQLAERSQELALQRAQIENATAVGLPGGAPGTGPSGDGAGPLGLPATVQIAGTSVPTAALAISALAVVGGGWYAFHGG